MSLHCGLLYLQRGIEFILHVSAINDLVLASPSHRSSLLRCLHRALCSLIQAVTSCIQKRVAVNGPFKGLSTKDPWQRNVLPTQVCCSTDLLDMLQITPTYGSL